MLGYAEFISAPYMQGSRPVGSRNKFGMTFGVYFSNLSWVAASKGELGGMALDCAILA